MHKKYKKTTGKKNYSVFAIFIVICSLLNFSFLQSCSDKEPAKDPPSIRQNLVLGLFRALEEGNHELALSNIKTLREISDSVFLAQLEVLEKQNLIMSKIQKECDGGNIEGAIQLCEKALTQFQRNEKFQKTFETLKILSMIRDSVNALNNADNWVATSRAAARLKTLALSYEPAKPLYEIANKKLQIAKEQMLREQKISLIDFSAEIISAKNNNARYLETMLIQLSIIDPKNPLLRE